MRKIFFCGAIVLIAAAAQAQSFVNLGFESAMIAATPVGGFGGQVDPLLAFPGWTAGIAGTSAAPLTLYNNATLGTPMQALIGPQSPSGLGAFPLSGSYSALLSYSTPTLGTGALAQTGLVPAGTRSISLQVSQFPVNFLVTLGGSPIALFDLGGGRIGGDVASFAGQVVPLVISALPGGLATHFDDIAFSAQPVPEPSSLALAAFLGGAGLWMSRRRRNAG